MPRNQGAFYTLLFAAAVCTVCGVLVSSFAVGLKPLQDENKRIDKQRNVLLAAGLLSGDDRAGPAEIAKLFSTRVNPEVIVLKNGENALVYQILDGDRVDMLVLPVEGKGLWSTLYGFLALDGKDPKVVRGIAFYEHAETPGLGGEIDNPKWRAKWKGRKVLDDDFNPAFTVLKGPAGPAEEDPHHVDGLSGATMTANGVTALVRFWLGDNGFGPYLTRFVKEGGTL